jgi:hypothetical protein
MQRTKSLYTLIPITVENVEEHQRQRKRKSQDAATVAVKSEMHTLRSSGLLARATTSNNVSGRVTRTKLMRNVERVAALRVISG